MSVEAEDRRRFVAADPQLLEFILQESDKRLAAQVQLMVASDQRASGILAGCITLSAAALGFAISRVSKPDDAHLLYAALAFGACEALAALFALTSLWPEQVNPQGWAPSTFAGDLKKSAHEVRAEVAHFVQQRIDRNRDASAKLARRIKWAMLMALEGPPLGLAAGLLASSATWPALAVAALAGGVFVWLGVPLLPGAWARGRR